MKKDFSKIRILSLFLFFAAIPQFIQARKSNSQILPANSTTFETNNTKVKMHRGINIGNALEAPNEGDWGVVIKDEYFKIIKEAGFDTVRIPIRWSNHAENAPPYKNR